MLQLAIRITSTKPKGILGVLCPTIGVQLTELPSKTIFMEWSHCNDSVMIPILFVRFSYNNIGCILLVTTYPTSTDTIAIDHFEQGNKLRLFYENRNLKLVRTIRMPSA